MRGLRLKTIQSLRDRDNNRRNQGMKNGGSTAKKRIFLMHPKRTNKFKKIKMKILKIKIRKKADKQIDLSFK